MEDNKSQKIYIDITLLELAKLQLDRENRGQKKENYSAADLLNIAKRILHWSEQKNRFAKKNKLDFSNGYLIIEERFIK